MVIISNSQRDDLVRQLRTLCEKVEVKDTKTFNARRRALKLIRLLADKPAVSAGALPINTNKSNEIKQP